MKQAQLPSIHLSEMFLALYKLALFDDKGYKIYRVPFVY